MEQSYIPKSLPERSTSPTENMRTSGEVITIFYHKSDLNALSAASGIGAFLALCSY